MPVHGIRADLELVALIVSAGVVSYFVSGALLSNVMFSFLLGALFFLIGLHIDLDFETVLDHRLDRLTIATLLVFVATPVMAYGFSFFDSSNVFLVLAASAMAIGSPSVWSNLSGGDGKLASVTGSTLFLLSFLVSPVMFSMVYPAADLQMLSINAAKFALPFLAGLALKNYGNFVVEDLRFHFSKVSFWLITVITLTQLEFLYTAGVLDIMMFSTAAVLFSVFTVASFGVGFAVSELMGFYQKESIALGYLSGTKNIALAFLLASQVGGTAIALVGVYYFIRQLTGEGIAMIVEGYDLSRIRGQY